MTKRDIITEAIKREGGFVDHEHDRGGATKYGITIKTLKMWRGEDVVVGDVRSLELDEAIEIYEKFFYDAGRVDEFPPAIREIYYDMLINHGQGNAVKILQRAMNFRGRNVDGKIGPMTLGRSERLSLNEVIVERCLFFASLIFDGCDYSDRTSQEIFKDGWIIKRCLDFVKPTK